VTTRAGATVRRIAASRAALAPWGLAACLLLLAAVIYRVTGHHWHSRPLDPAYLAVVAVGYLLAQLPRGQLTLEIRRHSYGIMWTDIPLVVGLFHLPGWAVIACAAVGLVLASLPAKSVPRRVAFNAANSILNVTVAAAVLSALPRLDPTAPMTWLVTYLAVGTATVVSALAVLAVIALVQGGLQPKMAATMLATSLAAGLLNTTLALILLMVVNIQAWASALITLIVTVFVLAYRGYSRSIRERKSLAELYEFTRSVGSSRQDGSLADTLLEKTRDFLRAERATLWLPALGRYPEVLLTARVDEGVGDEPLGEPDQLRVKVMNEGHTALVSARGGDDPGATRALRRRGLDEVIVTPLRSGSTVIGILEVGNRLGELSTFGPDDARLLKTLAAHAGVAVENSRLVHRLRHDAYHDALTGLPNRRRFSTALDEALAVRPVPGEVVAILLLDLDSFKDVNDTLGHVAGDRLLVEVGNRLRDVAPQGALVARMGGDEFAVLVRLPGAAAAHAEGTALQSALEEPVDIEGLSIDVGASVGIALFPDHAVDGVTLLQRAEVAMYAAKRAVRQVQTYLPTMDSLSVRRLSLVSELRRAIDEEQLQVYYQPKVSLSDQEFVGVEALVRWHHPEHGVVDPDDFIPVAEHTGMIGALTAYVLESALRQCRAWLDDGRQLHVAVNLSVRSLIDADFPDQVDYLLRETRVPPSMLTLEITESSVMSDIDRALPTLHRLREHGVRLSVDDFGTGHSSLTYLRRLPVTEVKIDKAFVLNMATDSGDLAIVRAIVDLGRHLGLTVVAEGVESEVAYTLLREMGCDMVQGFLLSRPVPYERLETWIRARTVLAPSSTGNGVPRLRVVGG
jgi:diguanylate cyclase (GGDEF)-like protein